MRSLWQESFRLSQTYIRQTVSVCFLDQLIDMVTKRGRMTRAQKLGVCVGLTTEYEKKEPAAL